MPAESGGEVPKYSVKSRRRWRTWLIGLFVVFVVSSTIWWFWPHADRMPKLAAELDEREPGWRWDDLQNTNVIPEEENAWSTLVLIAQTIPGFFAPIRNSPLPPPPNTFGPYSVRIGTDLARVGPTNPLPPELAQELATEASALAVVRPLLADLQQFTAIHPQLAPLEQQLKGVPWLPTNSNKLPDLFAIEMETALVNQNATQALNTAFLFVRALRFTGDSSVFNFGELFKNYVLSMRQLERVLAHGSGKPFQLQQIQAELQSINVQNQYERWLHLQRAFGYGLYDAVAHHADQLLKGRTLAWTDRLFFGFLRTDVMEGQTLLVEFYTFRLDQLHDRPGAQTRMDGLSQRLENSPSRKETLLGRLYRSASPGTQHADSQIAHVKRTLEPALLQAQAILAVSSTALAAERFRLAHQRWPLDLQELVPEFLSVVPTDPYDPNQPLRWKTTPNGRVVYSVGEDGKDDGGDCEWSDGNTLRDVGFRLFDRRVFDKKK
jgi:hypothetical protein